MMMMMMMSDSYLTREYTEITDGSWIMDHVMGHWSRSSDPSDLMTRDPLTHGPLWNTPGFRDLCPTRWKVRSNIFVETFVKNIR